MLEYYYKERRTLVDFRREPLGPYMDGFAGHLKKEGYSKQTALGKLGRCCQFNSFLIDQGATNRKAVSPSQIEPFLDVCLKDFRTSVLYDPRTYIRCTLRQLFAYLVENRILQPVISKPVVTRFSWMLEPYMKYLRDERQISEISIQRAHQKLVPFLEGLGSQVNPKQMKLLRPETIEEYVKKHIKESPDNLQTLVGALRGFLRFCAVRKYTTTDLSGVIPSIPSYRLASLPQGIEESNLQRILNMIHRDTPTGLRDYAIMLLMMAYGIRGKQAGELLLEDINWERSTIRIRAQKGGKEVVLPLLESVGEAILRYLRHRPESRCREIFLSKHAPFQSLSGLGISQLVRKYIFKAGVKMPGAGSRALRHSWAIRALAQDNPMKAIADVLGHRCLDTTFIYAKADLKTLRQVVMPWPGVKS